MGNFRTFPLRPFLHSKELGLARANPLPSVGLHIVAADETTGQPPATENAMPPTRSRTASPVAPIIYGLKSAPDLECVGTRVGARSFQRADASWARDVGLWTASKVVCSDRIGYCPEEGMVMGVGWQILWLACGVATVIAGVLAGRSRRARYVGLRCPRFPDN